MDSTNREKMDRLTLVSRNPVCAGVESVDLQDENIHLGNHFIRSHYPNPEIQRSEWSLSVTGSVDNHLDISCDELLELPSLEMVSLMECAGNSRSTVHPQVPGVQWEHGAIGCASWQGIAVSTVLGKASLRDSATNVFFRVDDADPDSISKTARCVPLSKLLELTTILAYRMDGNVIPKHHGCPVRLIVPGRYGMVSVKWLTNMTVMDSPHFGVYESEYNLYSAFNGNSGGKTKRVTHLKIKSLIANPQSGSLIKRNLYSISGIASCGDGNLTKVEVSFDDNRSWHLAEVGKPSYPSLHWPFNWEPTALGYYLIRSRVTDSNGNVQPFVAEWNYRGLQVNSGHCVPILVVEN